MFVFCMFLCYSTPEDCSAGKHSAIQARVIIWNVTESLNAKHQTNKQIARTAIIMHYFVMYIAGSRLVKQKIIPEW